jgi:hypothetical protein
MKNLALLFAFTVTTSLLAHQEYDARLFQGPSESQLKLAKSCYEEARLLGCGHPQQNRDYFQQCTQKQLQTFGEECQEFLGKNYSKT